MKISAKQKFMIVQYKEVNVMQYQDSVLFLDGKV